MTSADLAIFTICSNNYVPMAHVLLESAKRHHPTADLFLCLVDEPLDQPGFYPPDCVIWRVDSLPIPDFREFAFRYDVMELNTAVKPFMIRRLLEAGYRAVLYFDPDIEIFSELGSVLEPLRAGASFVLTPHLLEPAEDDVSPDDVAIMRAGIYNLGFLGVGAGAEAEKIVRWWSRRLTYQCVNDQPGGLFVDQKFMDLVPGFADRAHILRDPAMNVAYFNLAQRALSEAEDGWRVDNRPLGFFHFSGFAPRHLGRLSKYTESFHGDAISPALANLMRHYAERVIAHGHGTIPASAYAYGRFRSGTPIPAAVRHMFRERMQIWGGTDPFQSYENYMHLPAPGAWSGRFGTVTHLMRFLHGREPWLRHSFDLCSQQGAEGLTHWFLHHGSSLLGDDRLVQPIAAILGERSPGARPPPRSHVAGEPDVDVVGYLRSAMGVGEAGRLTLRALSGAGLCARGLNTTVNASAEQVDASCDGLLAETAEARFQVFCINADQLPAVVSHLHPVLRADAYRIQVPFWELASFPDAWLPHFDQVDEIWAPTRFIQTALMRKLRKPIVHMPLTLDFEAPRRRSREEFGLPQGTFLFFFAFDYLSYVARKNPTAVVEAFERAAQSLPGRARLVIKSLNAAAAPDAQRQFRDQMRENPDVILIERTLTRDDTLALIDLCDAVVSLHRSEGLGLLVAEAMALGKPVIATDYSATTELVTPETGYPVDFRLVPVQEGEYPLAAGQVWADPDIDHAAWLMRRLLLHPAEGTEKGNTARHHLARHYGAAAVSQRVSARLRQIEASR